MRQEEARAAGRRSEPCRLKRVIDIEDLAVWAVQREFAHLYADQAGLYEGEAAAAGLQPHGCSGAGLAQLQKIAGLGIRPDLSGPNTHCHPDAETFILVGRQALGPLIFSLVVPFAKVAGRPDWGAHLRPLEAGPDLVWDDRAHEYRPCVMTAGRAKAPYCAVKYRDRVAEIEAARGYYVAWWDALAALAEALKDRLDFFAPTPPAAPRRPWLVEKNVQNPLASFGGD